MKRSFSCSGSRAIALGLLVAAAGLSTPVRGQDPAPPPATPPPAQDAPLPPPTQQSPPAEIEGAQIAKIWHFDTDGDSEGWQAGQNVAPLEVSGGRLVIQNVGSDPFILGPSISTDASQFQFIGIHARSSAAGLTQIFYSTRAAPGFHVEQMLVVPMEGDGVWKFHQVDLRPIRRWRSELENLRLDPVNGEAELGAVTEIDWIALYQTQAQIEALLPHWLDGSRLSVGFENRGGLISGAPIELSVEGVPVGSIPRLQSPGQASVEIDAGPLPSTFWLEAKLNGECIWRGRMCKPLEPAPSPANARPAAPRIAVGSGMARLSRGNLEQSVRLAPLASLTIRGPGKAHTYYEFAPRIGRASPARSVESFEESLVDPLVGTLRCTTRIEGLRVRTSLEASAPIEVLRFEGPRMLQARPPSHAIFPGIEFLEHGEESSQAAWVGPSYAERASPERYKITIPMIAFEYDRPLAGTRPIEARMVPASSTSEPAATEWLRAGESQGAGSKLPWISAMTWNIESGVVPGTPAPSVEFLARRVGPSYATAFLPALPDRDANLRYASSPLALPAGALLELEVGFRVDPGTFEELFDAFWREHVPAPPHLEWAAEDERVAPELRRGPGSKAALEKILEISMRAYTQTLFSAESGGWKTHIAIGEAYAPRKVMRALVMGESARSRRPEYAATIGLAPRAQIEEWMGTAHWFAGIERRGDACRALARMGHDGGVPYELTAEMRAKIEEFSEFYELSYSPFGTPGATNPGLTSLGAQPLFEYAACTRDPIFIAAAERALRKINSYTVPRGAQTWEIHMQTPDLYGSAVAVLANIWGYRITGEEHYLDEALRWARAGLPFVYSWEPPEAKRLRSVQIADQLGEGPELAERDPGLFYEDTRRQVAPFAAIPVFGTSWFAVPWFGIPVQWCGLAWGNAIRELDSVRPVPHLVRIADGLFRSAANQQADKSYLAGTLPDSWDLALGSSRQPYIVPDRILEYAYRELGAPYVENLQYARLETAPWTHVASRALIREPQATAHTLQFGARFFEGQSASALIGCQREPSSVTVNGRKLDAGRKQWCADWNRWDDARGAVIIRWEATGGDDRIEVVSR